MAQVSNFASEDPEFTNAGDQPKEGKTNSLLSKVKDTAKGTVRKLKSKVKKGSDESSEERPGTRYSDDSEDPSPKAQSEFKELSQTTGTDDVKEDLNGSERKVSFTGTSEDDLLSPFARSGKAENAPLIASPTSYSEQQNNVEDVMPPSIIKPTSVSELGEESSSNLGNIPEAKEEEKAAVKEVQEGGPDSDINKGFKDTFQQKDLQAIDGLPKPRGFDDDNENSVKSNDLRFQLSQDLANESFSQETEGSWGGAYKGSEREFPVEGSTKGIEEDKEKPHPPGTWAEFKDSMFSSGAIHDLKPNEPNAAEAKHADEIGTFSRDFDPEANKATGKEGDQQHPPGSIAEFNDSMFSSGAIQDLKPNEPNAAEAKHANEVGTFSRDFNPGTEGDKETVQHPPAAESELHENMLSSAIASDLKPSPTDEPSSNVTNSEAGAPVGDVSRQGESEGTKDFLDAPKDLPSPALAGERMDDVSHKKGQQSDGSLLGRDDGSYDRDNMPITAEEEAENFFDALSDEGLASQRSLDSDVSKDFNPGAAAEFNEQKESLTEPANSRIEAAADDEIAAKTRSSDSNATEGTSTLKSTLTSVVGAVGAKVGLGSSTSQSSSAENNGNGGDTANSASDRVSTWFSSAFGALLTKEQEDKKDITEVDR